MFSSDNIPVVVFIAFALIWFIYSIMNEILVNLSIRPSKDRIFRGGKFRGKKYDLAPFNDALANELMKIRLELAAIRIKQSQLDTDTPSDFLRMFLVYGDYETNFICTTYDAPNNELGRIIIALNNAFTLDESGEFNALTLRKLHSWKAPMITSGDQLSVFVCESIKDLDCTSARDAKVLSIEDKGGSEFCITLEINMHIDNGHYWSVDDEEKKDIIIRKVIVHSDKYGLFLPDKSVV